MASGNQSESPPNMASSKNDQPTAVETDLKPVEPPKDKFELADDFRAYSNVSMQPIEKHFFCNVCGSPAGDYCWTCVVGGHQLCNLCKNELNVTMCWKVVKQDEENQLCRAGLVQLCSDFRASMNRAVQVTCRFEGCDKCGIWNEIKTHQETCSFKS